jgi:glycosyltransferase involved in cell wall biosynthesis
MGIPVIVPDTAIDRYYFDDSVAKFFKANDEKSLADAMLLLITNSEIRRSLVRNADSFMKKYTWDENKAAYLTLVDSLVQSSNGRRSHD